MSTARCMSTAARKPLSGNETREEVSHGSIASVYIRPWRRSAYWRANPRLQPDGACLPRWRGVRLHDLRHTAAVLWLTAGDYFIKVAKWLGHSSYVLTLTIYADYIPEQETENPLPEPVAPANVDTGNVLNLHRSTAG